MPMVLCYLFLEWGLCIKMQMWYTFSGIQSLTKCPFELKSSVFFKGTALE